VSSIEGLAAFVSLVVRYPLDLPTIVLQPWEGLTTTEVLRNASGRSPRRISRAFARTVVGLGYIVGAAVPRFKGTTRRLEVMWFGQAQEASWAQSIGIDAVDHVSGVLRGDS